MRALLIAAFILLAGPRPPNPAGPPPLVFLARPVADSLDSIFRRSTAHWDELADLNNLEKMLGTVRPTQLEYLGCLIGERRGDTLLVDDWAAAHNMKRLQFAVTGDCEGVPRLLGTFHTHPYLADSANRAVKQRGLAPQDLHSFSQSSDLISLVIWDQDSVDAAVRSADGQVVYPAVVRVH